MRVAADEARAEDDVAPCRRGSAAGAAGSRAGRTRGRRPGRSRRRRWRTPKPVRSAAPLPWLWSWQHARGRPASASLVPDQLARPVGRAVVDEDDLLPGNRRAPDRVDHALEGGDLVVAGDHHGEAERGEIRHEVLRGARRAAPSVAGDAVGASARGPAPLTPGGFPSRIGRMPVDASTLERLVPAELDSEDVTGRQTLELHVERYRFAARAARPGRLLDLACGVGYGTRLVADEAQGIERALGVDLAPEAVAYARAATPAAKASSSRRPTGSASATPSASTRSCRSRRSSTCPTPRGWSRTSRPCSGRGACSWRPLRRRRRST